FGNELRGSPGAYPISIEATAPVLHGAQYSLVKDGRRMTGVAAAGGYADFYANLTDEYPGVDIRNLFADFSQLGGDSRMPVSSCRRELTCRQVEVDETTGKEICIGKLDDVYVCVWSNVFVKIGETTEAKIAIDAADMFGNKGTISIDWDMELDNTDPAIRHLGVGEEHVRDGKNWYLPRPDTMLVVVVDETGSGVEKDNVNFNYDSTSIKATNCTAVSGGYKCWVEANPGKEVDLGVSVTDNVGNSVSGTEKLILDETPAVNKTITITAENPLYFRAGDEGFKITAVLEDDSGFKNDKGEITASADLSEVFGDAYSYKKADDCTLNGTEWTCTWDISTAIPETDEEERDIVFNFTDVAGNPMPLTRTIKVRKNADAEPNFYRLSIKKEYVLPIEKYTIENMAGNYLQLIPFDLINRKTCGDAEAYGWRMAGSCSDSLVFMQRKPTGDYVGFIQLVIDPNVDFDSTKADYTLFNCRLEFTSRCGNTIYGQPERESINISIPIVEEFDDKKNPEDKIMEKVEEIKDETSEGYTKVINTLDDVFNVANNICTIKNMIGGLLSICGTLRGIGAVLAKVPPTSAAGEAVNQGGKTCIKGGGNVWKGLKKVADVACGITMCEEPESGGISLPGLGDGEANIVGGWCGSLKRAMLDPEKGTSFGKAFAATGSFYQEHIRQTSTLDLCKQSFIFSAACLCLPGIVYNLKKARQLKCMKGVCYRDYTGSGYYTMDECDRQYEYDLCVYIAGQFTAITFPLNDLFKFITDFFDNPAEYAGSWVWTLAKFGLEKGCDVDSPAQIDEPNALLCILRGAALLFEGVVSIVQNVKAVGEMEWKAEIDYCEQLHNPKEE
ncbi:hypothetical protein KY345_05550, partial [Candidatus Woesearchaeota archaeon]|nr:hypothetical protein [Candidatus Woesearchaeota archaeon]